MSNERIYSIPARFRRVENLHILLWLIKDACWATSFKTLGVFMIIPTLTVAIVITWQTRKMLAELIHNLAVVFWISANCLWMIGEFFGWDEGKFGLRHMALIPFGIGLAILFYYYVFLAPSARFNKSRCTCERRIIPGIKVNWFRLLHQVESRVHAAWDPD